MSSNSDKRAAFVQRLKVNNSSSSQKTVQKRPKFQVTTVVILIRREPQIDREQRAKVGEMKDKEEHFLDICTESR